MSLKVCLLPTPAMIEINSGIGRVAHAQYRYLPEHDIEFVGTPEEADVTAAHAHDYGMFNCDVIHAHGLYWSDYEWTTRHDDINREIIASYRRARVITVPSEWVAMPLKRDMHINPVVIGHGIELSDWQVPTENQGYALWNKSRRDPVCDPTPAYELAKLGIPVVSTFAPERARILDNFYATGFQEEAEMRSLVANADVYLATTKETFGIGVLEAMACGVPILGFNHGGTRDIVKHGKTGHLARPGDYQDLLAGYNFLRANRSRISDACREAAQAYDWRTIVARYAELYSYIADQKATERHRVSVIIPCYNYANYVNNAIDSVLAQTRIPDEIVVVNDGSTDNTAEVLRDYGNKIRVVTQENQGLSAARNAGIAQATSEYVCCLDADDSYEPEFIERTLSVIQKDRSLGVVTTKMHVLEDDGSKFVSDWPPDSWQWENFAVDRVPPPSIAHVASLFRKSMWERAGGYKSHYPTAEDVEFWLRGLSLGFTTAIVKEALFNYRNHSKSMSHTVEYVPITDWFPWIFDKKYPLATPTDNAPIVRSYSEPVVTIVVDEYRLDSQDRLNIFDKLKGQSYWNYEVVTVNEDDVLVYPWIRTEPYLGNALEFSNGKVVVYVKDENEITDRQWLERLIMGCCGSNSKTIVQAEMPAAQPGMVRMEYTGDRVGSVPYKVNGRRYVGSLANKLQDVLPEDVAKLAETGDWRRVESQVIAPARIPEPVAPRVVMPEATRQVNSPVFETDTPDYYTDTQTPAEKRQRGRPSSRGAFIQ